MTHSLTVYITTRASAQAPFYQIGHDHDLTSSWLLLETGSTSESPLFASSWRKLAWIILIHYDRSPVPSPSCGKHVAAGRTPGPVVFMASPPRSGCENGSYTCAAPLTPISTTTPLHSQADSLPLFRLLSGSQTALAAASPLPWS